MVSYIYDEIATAERRKFETHLVDCSVCTDEFAEISNARFSVFEWQKEEFTHLPTPGIVIPYASKRRVVEETVPVGFMAGLRGLLSSAGMPAMGAAALLVCLGVGFAAFMFIRRSDDSFASNVKIEDLKSTPVITVDNPDQVVAVPQLSEIAPTVPLKNITPVEPASRPVKALEQRRSRPNRQITAERSLVNESINQRAPRLDKAPVLSSYDDNVDKSLRLSDLFDDGIGGRR